MRTLLMAGVLASASCLVNPAKAAIIGGFNIVASADSLISSTGIFNTNASSVTTALTDSSTSTYVFSYSSGASVTLGFSSGITNGQGNDFVLYELGDPDTFKVTLNGLTLSFLSSDTGVQSGGFELNAAAIDLSLFGLAAGSTVSSVVIGLDTVSSITDTSPSLSFAGVINAGNGTPAAVPEPASLTLLGMGAASVAAVRRRRA